MAKGSVVALDYIHQPFSLAFRMRSAALADSVRSSIFDLRPSTVRPIWMIFQLTSIQLSEISYAIG